MLIWATAVVMVLDELGVNLAAIGIGASIIGVAIGFGSQALVRDFLSGIFMLIEDQYGVGDVIDTGVATGTVEGVSLRTTRLRDAEGTVWHVPNGEIRRVGNKSQQWSRVILDVAVAYDADLGRATYVIRSAADEVAAEPGPRSGHHRRPRGLGDRAGRGRPRADPARGEDACRSSSGGSPGRCGPGIKAALDDAGIGPASESVITYRVGRRPARARPLASAPDVPSCSSSS